MDLTQKTNNQIPKHPIYYTLSRTFTFGSHLEVPTPSTPFTSKDMDQHVESDVHLPFDDLTKTVQETSPLSSTFNQAGLNDLVCHLGLGKVNSELLVSRLKEKNALAPDTNITFASTREQACWCALMKKKIGNGNFVYCQTFKDS